MNNFKNRVRLPRMKGLAGRVIAVGLVPLIFLAALSTFIYFEVKKLNDSLAHLLSNTIPALSTGAEITSEINNIDRIFWQAQTEHNKPENLTNTLVDADAALERINASFSLYREYALPPVAANLRITADQSWQKINPMIERLKIELQKKEAAQAHVIHQNELSPEINSLKETLSNIGLNNSNVLEAYKKNATSRVLTALIFGFLMTIAASSLISFLIMRKPISLLEESGDRLESAGQSLIDTSHTIKNASDTFSISVSESAVLIQSTSSSTEELDAMAKISSESSMSAQKLAAECENKASESSSEVKRLVTSIQEIADSSNQMRNIISVIDDIAFQTNLLALNAAVEAARAGEHGRGFAVVADAVRALSQKSSVSSKEIADLIALTLTKIEVGSKIAATTASSLSDVVDQIKTMSQMNASISQATVEQSSGIANINKSMNELNNLIQSNAKEAHNTGTASAKLLVNSETLTEITKQIKTVVNG